VDRRRVIRDLVWERRFAKAAPGIQPGDVDVAFFDGGDLRRERDGAQAASITLARRSRDRLKAQPGPNR
jgi:hypothetical protein